MIKLLQKQNGAVFYASQCIHIWKRYEIRNPKSDVRIITDTFMVAILDYENDRHIQC